MRLKKILSVTLWNSYKEHPGNARKISILKNPVKEGAEKISSSFQRTNDKNGC